MRARSNRLAVRVAVAEAVAGSNDAGRDLVGDEGAHFLAQRLTAFRQAGRDLIEDERLAVMYAVRSGTGEVRHREYTRPEFVGAARRDLPLPERFRPMAFVAEVVPPSEHAQRIAM